MLGSFWVLDLSGMSFDFFSFMFQDKYEYHPRLTRYCFSMLMFRHGSSPSLSAYAFHVHGQHHHVLDVFAAHDGGREAKR